MDVSFMKQPGAYLPMAMSLTAFALVLSHVLFVVVHEADEGTAAHLWQLLMVGQVPVVAYFALKWRPFQVRSTGCAKGAQTESMAQ